MSSRARLVQLIAAAAVVGACLHFFYFSVAPESVFTGSSPVNSVELKLDPRPVECPQPITIPSKPMVDLSRPPVPGEPEDEADRLSYLRAMVAHTKGYYVRDWSLGLGWNNMRYIIEASLMHAALLNRTLVLPSFVYARACEHHISVCAQYAFMVNRGDAIGWNDWRDLPIEQQMGFRIPMDVMLNITLMRQKYNVLTFLDYLDLHSLPRNIEWGSGAWDRNGYHAGGIPLFVIPNEKYDPSDIVRVDTYPETGKQINVVRTDYAERLRSALGDKIILDWDPAKAALGISDDKQMSHALKEAGWVELHTFAPFLGMEFVKSPVWPTRQVAPHESVHGLLEEYGHPEEEVVLLAGETHLNRKPGSLRFTTREALDDYMRLCLHDLQYIERLQIVAKRAGARMTERVQGRMWMAAQMRRGDFAKLGWAMEKTVEGHFQRIVDRLKKGREVIISLLKERKHTPHEVPDIVPALDFFSKQPPNEGDPFYLATDERSPEGLQYARQNGAVFIHDLITFEDRQFVGWPLLVTDVLALLEQLVMAQSEYFYGHAMSSVAGGVVNMRAARGVDSRTYLID
ncbi:hypothetical protein EXIGLDRAFT_724109 [Exidia glandulosa HHB12029]|uniref:O-fucosyltransferase family protein n=1 Tax=Exidia glandulosa HHB12029 TaxID=1314781 RepID=A0A165EJP6_EXIGL|nr:hypothetical protein EXIGLDRAFT_724109 [Exidia glandulosa HHB12029]